MYDSSASEFANFFAETERGFAREMILCRESDLHLSDGESALSALSDGESKDDQRVWQSTVPSIFPVSLPRQTLSIQIFSSS